MNIVASDLSVDEELNISGLPLIRSMSSRTKKVLLFLTYAAAIAAVVDICIVSPRQSAMIIASDWPSDPHALTRGALQGIILLGVSSFLLLFVSVYSGRQKILVGTASLLTLGFLLVRAFPIPEKSGWILSGTLALIAVLSFLGVGIFRRKGDPIVPPITLSLSLSPYIIGLSALYPWLWYLPMISVGAVLGWATAHVYTFSRSKAGTSLIVGIIFGSMAIPIQLRTFRLSWYGYHISFDSLQFGKINGDETIDLMTHGYCGMVAGNFYWFAGHGDSFDDWRNSHSIDRLGQICGRLLDIDSDGDADIVCSNGIYLNSNGVFHAVYEHQLTSQDESNAEEMFFAGLWLHHSPVGIDIFGADLTGDGKMELISVPEFSPYPYNSGGKMIIGLCRKDTEWIFSMFDIELGVGLENPEGKGGMLVLPKQPNVELIKFLNDHQIRHRITVAPIPTVPAEAETVEYHWLDFDGDKQAELAICSEHETTSGAEQIKHFGGSGNYTPTVCRVKVYREMNEGFRLLGAMETQPYICSQSDTPIPIQQFGDIDKDGLLDFLGQEGHVYLLRKNWSFDQKRRLKLANRDRMARLYLHDLNGDDNLDVISSFQPFWNLELGPLIR